MVIGIWQYFINFFYLTYLKKKILFLHRSFLNDKLKMENCLKKDKEIIRKIKKKNLRMYCGICSILFFVCLIQTMHCCSLLNVFFPGVKFEFKKNILFYCQSFLSLIFVFLFFLSSTCSYSTKYTAVAILSSFFYFHSTFFILSATETIVQQLSIIVKST